MFRHVVSFFVYLCDPEEETAENAIVVFHDKVTGVDAINKIEDDAKKVPNVSRIIIVSRERTSSTMRQIDLINSDPNRSIHGAFPRVRLSFLVPKFLSYHVCLKLCP